MTKTETSHRSNRFAASCNRCGEHIDAEAGYLYRGYGRDSRWTVKCLDFETCEARRTAGFAVKAEAHHAERIAADARLAARYAEATYPDPYDSRAQGAARRHAARAFDPTTVAKTVSFTWGDYEITTARRKTSRGATVRTTQLAADGTTYSDLPDRYATEAEAAAGQVRFWRSQVNWAKRNGVTAEQLAAVQAWLAGHAA